jgi:hypothetical protein
LNLPINRPQKSVLERLSQDLKNQRLLDQTENQNLSPQH